MWCCQPVTHRGAGGGGRSAGRRTPSRQGGCAGGLDRGEADFPVSSGLRREWGGMVALHAARVGNDQIAGNVAGWGISEIMRTLRLWRVERKRSDAKASRRDATACESNGRQGSDREGALNWRDGWASPSGSSDRAEPVASRSLSFVPDRKAGAQIGSINDDNTYSTVAFGVRRDQEFHPFYLKRTPNCLKNVCLSLQGYVQRSLISVPTAKRTLGTCSQLFFSFDFLINVLKNNSNEKNVSNPFGLSKPHVVKICCRTTGIGAVV